MYTPDPASCDSRHSDDWASLADCIEDSVTVRLRLARLEVVSLFCFESLSLCDRAFLPVRCVTRYSQVVPLLTQRTHCGLSLEHLVLDAAQA